ncbi:MAG: hydrolase [Rickettsiales bacterium]|jgi:nicotinamidase-related amidase|nr:hydrolase [Rickettsiales bacterium]
MPAKTAPKIRNPKTDHLITPENSVLIIIDYQPKQIESINSMPRAEMLKNIAVVAAASRVYKIPVILSTVNVRGDPASDTVPIIKNSLPRNIKTIDRTFINSWEDENFRAAVKKTGRLKLIMCALWTEACLSFPTLDALSDGYEVYPVVDAVGGTSWAAHTAALIRMERAGAQPTTTAQLLCELQRDWARTATVPDFTKLLTAADVFLNTGK